MNALTEREKRDIEKIASDKNYYYFLPEYRKTAAVSMAAVTACGANAHFLSSDFLTSFSMFRVPGLVFYVVEYE